jgi:hypothetical protein
MAVALDDSKVDPAFGVFVNVQLMPSGEKYTAIVGADYEGPGFGLYSRIKRDDDLVVMIPLGDPRAGVHVIRRLWSAADGPPAEAVLDPTEVMLVVEPNRNLRLKVTGTGKVEIDSAATVTVNCPDIRLGDLAPTDFVAMAQKVLDELTAVKADIVAAKTVFDAHTHVLALAAASGSGGTGTAAVPVTPIPTPHDPASVACETTKVK